MTVKTFHVAGMHCPNCCMRLEALEDELDGIVRIRADYRKALIEVEFDESKTDFTRLFRLASEQGYCLSEA
jgi:copper chaperone CopZ